MARGFRGRTGRRPRRMRVQPVKSPTVIGPFGERMEVQIRTNEMHRIAEAGIAAHWKCKGQNQQGSPQEIERFAWLRQLLHWQQHLEDPQEFMRSVKEDLFDEEVFAFTPRGDLFNFPQGATVIDFAPYFQHCEPISSAE